MKDNALNVRLCACAQLIRQDAVFADIGTDHAYLPIFLLKEGRIKKAYCSDVNEGPLMRAKENAKASGLLSKTEFYLTDGAAALSGLGITDYAICGMGGELIAEIISKAQQLKDPSVNLILQPMSKQATLRRFLAKEGFEVIREAYSLDGERSYVCLLATYTGISRELGDAEAEIGCQNTEIVNKDLQIKYLNGKLHAYEKMIEGKITGNIDATAEQRLAKAIREYIEKT